MKNKKSTLKIGVLGAGHLGKIHIKLLKEIPLFEITGFYDIKPEVAAHVAETLQVKPFGSAGQLIAGSDVIDVVTPTATHYGYAAQAIKSGKHVFIEKPVTATEKEARSLLALEKEAHVKVQVGHVERFNPAFLAVQNMGIELNPMFIEAHRLAQFNPRGADVSVVLDLMIHDIDIVLNIVRSGVKKISASGVAVVSKSPDIANARIEFTNGCVANLTASRISMKQMRKIRFFQKDAYISIDLAQKQADVFLRRNEISEGDPSVFAIDTAFENEKLYVQYTRPQSPEINSIKMELELFAKAIIDDTEPKVTLLDGYSALHVAHQVLHKIEHFMGIKK
jgi:predicted dehydrogenase